MQTPLNRIAGVIGARIAVGASIGLPAARTISAYIVDSAEHAVVAGCRVIHASAASRRIAGVVRAHIPIVAARAHISVTANAGG